MHRLWVLATATLASSVHASTLAWSSSGNATWSHRSSAGFTSFTNTSGEPWSAVVAGGRNVSQLLNDVWALGTDGHWVSVLGSGKAPWTPREDHVLTWFDRTAWVIAGQDDTYPALRDVWLSSDFVSWHRMPDPPWQNRTQHAVCTLGGSMFVLGGQSGGQSGSAPYTFLADVWSINGTSGAWEQRATPPWTRRAGHGCAVLNGRLYITGGQDLFEPFGDVWWTRDGVDWTASTLGNNLLSRVGARLVVMDDRMWFVGGVIGVEPQSPVVWSIDGVTWPQLPSRLSNTSAEVSRDSGIVVVVNGTAIIGGGLALGGFVLANSWEFHPCSKTCFNGGTCVMDTTPRLNSSCSCAAGWLPPNCSQHIAPRPTPTPSPSASPSSSPSSSPSPGPGAGAAPVRWLLAKPWRLVVVCVAFVVLVILVIWVCRRCHEEKTRFRMSVDPQLAMSHRISADWIIDAKSVSFKKDRPIGVGGFAQVFKGKYHGRSVAVKVIHTHLLRADDKKALYMERFLDEAEMMTRLHHPNLLCLLGLVVRPQLCLITEFAPYGSLSAILSVPPGTYTVQSPYGPSTPRRGLRGKNRPTPPASPKAAAPLTVTPAIALKIAHQIACGVQCLHSKNITHRDLNTNNVLVFSLDYNLLNVRVADFGLSRELADMTGTTMTEVLLAEGAKYDEKADVYSFGVLLWAIAQYLYLSNRRDGVLSKDQHMFLMRPYGDWAPMKVLRQVMDGARPTPPPPQFPHATLLLDLMVQCWDHNPALRPSFDTIVNHMESLHPFLRDASPHVSAAAEPPPLSPKARSATPRSPKARSATPSPPDGLEAPLLPTGK